MKMSRASLLVVCLFVFPVLAQEAQPEGVPPEAPGSERSLKIFQSAAPRPISSETDVPGTFGTLLLDVSPDVILRANNTLRFQSGGATDRFWLTSNGHAAFGALFDLGRVSIFEYGDTVRALNAYQRSTIESNVTQNDFGVAFQAYTDIASGATNLGSMYGTHIDARNYGPGTLTNLNGLSVYAGNLPSGGTATTTNVTGFYTQVQQGSGTIGTGYGVRIGDTLATNDYGVYQHGADDTNYFAGNTGIGTSSPLAKLHVLGADDASTVIISETTSTGGSAAASFKTSSTLSSTSYVAHGNRDASMIRFGIPLAGWGEIVNFNGNGFVMGTTLNTPVVLGTNNAERVRILGNGNVGIGITAPTAKLHVNGNILAGDAHFNGAVTGWNIRAHFQDVAEWVPATSDLAPGTVVTLNRARDNEVMASVTAYDTSVAGVVSAQPGITLGVEGEGMEQIATTGRVKVRVDARRNPIGVGDLLVTSDIPGTAMRSEPMDINGRKFHQPGTIIGKALQPLEGGIGEILVLLSMQ